MLKRVYEIDPLECPECGNALKIVRFIERRQTDVIQRILRHFGPWQVFIRGQDTPRAPPKASSEFELVPDGEFLEAHPPSPVHARYPNWSPWQL